MKFATKLSVLNFTDDTLLYCTFDNPLDLESYFNSELRNINKWLIANHLKVKSLKSKFMIFVPKTNTWKNLGKLNLTIGNSEIIQQVDKYKYLGIIIDCKLNWEPHIKYISTKLSKTLGILFRTRHYLNKQSLILIFQTLFLSHLRYGILCWGRCSKTALKPLTVLMNRALRCIHFCGYRDSVKKFYFELNILHIDDLFKLELAKFMHQYSNGLLPINFNHYFTKANNTHNHKTRFSKNNFKIPKQNKNIGLKSLAYLGPKVWSKVPHNIKINPNNYYFSKMLTNYFLKSCLNNNLT